MSYGIDLSNLSRLAASDIDLIVKGTKPSDIPFRLPTKHELIINVTVAKALGLTIPPSLLARADEVIESEYLLRCMSPLLCPTAT
jgi:putative ABC transport system substrate-binding protein